MTISEIEQAIACCKAHFQETLGNLPEPIRVMMELCPQHRPGKKNAAR